MTHIYEIKDMKQFNDIIIDFTNRNYDFKWKLFKVKNIISEKQIIDDRLNYLGTIDREVEY